MKQIFLSFVLAFVGVSSMSAQYHEERQRTPEEIALKQTCMLVHELGLKDSIQIDSLYHMHLHYAYLHQQGSTRQQDMDRMLQMHEDLKRILTAEQYASFMNHQCNHGPRQPKPSVCVMQRGSHCNHHPQIPNDIEENKQP